MKLVEDGNLNINQETQLLTEACKRAVAVGDSLEEIVDSDGCFGRFRRITGD